MSDFEMPADEKDTKFDLPTPPSEVEDSKTKQEGPKEIKYSEDELNRVFDEIMFQGSYSEQMKLKNGRLVVTFRSRTAEEVTTITQKLDAMQATLIATLSDKRSVLNLEYALQAIQGTDLTKMSHEARAKYIGNLPGVVVGMLVNAMNVFDTKVYQACKDAEINF